MSQTGSRGQGGPPKPPIPTGKVTLAGPPRVANPPAPPPPKPQPPRASMPSKPTLGTAPRPVSAPAWTADGVPSDGEPMVVATPAEKTAGGSGSFSRDEVRAIVRVALDEAISPLQHLLRDVEQRVAELEQRPHAPSSPVFEPTIASTPAALAHAQVAAAALPPPPTPPSVPGPYASAIAPTPRPPPPVAVPAALAPRMSLAAIEHDVKLDDLDLGMLDGRRRKRRNAMLLVFFLVVVFGGMGSLLARSYIHIQ